jgi:tetratricopeptide (TPR) repeat protein
MKRCNIADCSKLPLLLAAVVIVFAAEIGRAEAKEIRALKEDKQQVKAWNTFADRLYSLHKYLLAQHAIRTETEQGGYARHPNIYTETRYYDKNSNRLLSRVQRMNDNSKLIQLIEVNIYNPQGEIVRDYLAAYLPYNRNAPIQTLINLHSHHGHLQGYRQFDASGERIYEQCEGHYGGKPVMISLEEYEFGKGPYRDSKTLNSAAYKICFSGVPTSAQAYLNPLKEIDASKAEQAESTPQTADDYAKLIDQYSLALKQNPKDVDLLIKRGDLYFLLHEFEQAIADYSDAIELDKHADAAYFGRGMALGRYGQIRAGIQDLSVYLSRHPNESRAHTKRGIRYVWIHEYAKAEKDFVRAIQINPANAEAHDDLGVIHARRGDYLGALKHFNAAIKLDPTYFKAFHNQAMVYYINGQDALALDAVEHALALVPDLRNSMLLKADILRALGRTQEAAKIKEDAEFLPEGNWSERIPVQ